MLKKDLKFKEIKEFLDEKVLQYNQPDFIKDDPIQIPHLFENKFDIEVIGFIISTISWGKRNMIINSAHKILSLMDNKPYDFIINHSQSDLESMSHFVHRTFQAEDLKYFIKTLKRIYNKYETLENVFLEGLDLKNDSDMRNSISHFHNVFFENCLPNFRTRKHLANPEKGSASKRLNMYLRWMVRKDNQNVDFGIWQNIPTSFLSCPLDVHTGNVGRALGFITRNQNDWKTVEELDKHLRMLDPIDPVKYDFALFGLGVFEGWK